MGSCHDFQWAVGVLASETDPKWRQGSPPLRLSRVTAERQSSPPHPAAVTTTFQALQAPDDELTNSAVQIRHFHSTL